MTETTKGKSEEELIEIISQNMKYSPDFLRGMTSSIPLEELAVISKEDKGSIYKLQVPIFFGTTAIPFGLLIAGKLKPSNTTFKFLGGAFLGLVNAKIASLFAMYSGVKKEFPDGVVASMGRSKFLSNVFFYGRNVYGEGWIDQKDTETLDS